MGWTRPHGQDWGSGGNFKGQKGSKGSKGNKGSEGPNKGKRSRRSWDDDGWRNSQDQGWSGWGENMGAP
eukprot:12688374-Alexandrium_andersonii.AAC.1